MKEGTEKVEEGVRARVERVEIAYGERIRVESRLMEAFYSLFGKLNIGPLSRQSPLRLNDLGKAISQEVGGVEWARRVVNSLTDWIEGKDAYQIQEYCFEFVEGFAYTDQELSRIRDSAYRNGLPTEQIRRVLAVELRDKLPEMAGLEAPD